LNPTDDTAQTETDGSSSLNRVKRQCEARGSCCAPPAIAAVAIYGMDRLGAVIERLIRWRR
jgi:hypothetical protein